MFMKSDVLRIILSFTTIALLLYIVYDKFHNVVKEEENTSVPQGEVVEIDLDLTNTLLDKLPKIFYCDNYPMSYIFKSTIVKSDDITTEIYNDDYDSCKNYYDVFRKLNKAYKDDGVIYIEEYILLYNRNKGIYGTSYDQHFNINSDNIIKRDDVIDDSSFINYGKLYKHTFKLNSVGVYLWYSTSNVEVK